MDVWFGSRQAGARNQLPLKASRRKYSLTWSYIDGIWTWKSLIGPLLYLSWSKAIADQKPITRRIWFNQSQSLLSFMCRSSNEPSQKSALKRAFSLACCSVRVLIINLMASYHAHAATKDMCNGSHGCSLPLLGTNW